MPHDRLLQLKYPHFRRGGRRRHPNVHGRIYGEYTRSVLFAHKTLNEMDKADRIRACYLHCCLNWVKREAMNNTTVRERFGIEVQNKAQASRIIKQTIEAGLIKPYDADSGARSMRYVPFWD